VAFCNTPEYLSALEGSTSQWSRLVQSGAQSLPLPLSGRLAGRSASVMVSLLTLYSTTVALVAYMAYMGLWADLRVWLSAKAAAAAAAPHHRDEGHSSDDDDAAAPPPGFTAIGGCLVSEEQLLEAARSPAAALLLDAQGLVGRVSSACLHVCGINVLCMLCLMGSRLLSGRLLPAVLPQHLLDAYYPVLPTGLQQGACAAGAS
jgi:hypothetical protein